MRVQKHGKTRLNLFEVILMVTIMGVLAIVIMPHLGRYIASAHTSYQNNDEAKQVQKAINQYYTAQITRDGVGKYPDSLDAGTAQKNCFEQDNGCFGRVLRNPIRSSHWKKMNDNKYLYIPTEQSFTYHPESGLFARQ
jgi:type II secretory pathway pseudopilin PulG